jgi:hypothetical protein
VPHSVLQYITASAQRQLGGQAAANRGVSSASSLSLKSNCFITATQLLPVAVIQHEHCMPRHSSSSL